MLDAAQRKTELLKGVSLCAAMCAVPLFFYFDIPRAEPFYPWCVWRMATGLYCPGCGTLRALRALSGGDLGAAFAYNPFLFIMVIPLFVYLTAIFLARAATGKRIPSILSSPNAVMPALVIIIAVWVLRNVFPPPQ